MDDIIFVDALFFSVSLSMSCRLLVVEILKKSTRYIMPFVTNERGKGYLKLKTKIFHKRKLFPLLVYQQKTNI